MESELVLCAFLEIWHRLPVLVGRSWSEVQPAVEAILERLRQSAGAGRSPLIRDLVRTLAAYDQARQLLNDTVRKLPERLRASHEPVHDEPSLSWPRLTATLSERLEGSALRYPDLTYPERLTVGRRGAVTVVLNRFPATKGLITEAIEVQLHEPLELRLQSRSDTVEVVDPAVVILYPDQPPGVFFLFGKQPGAGALQLDFWQSGRFLHSLDWTIEVCAEPRASDSRRLRLPALSLRTGALPPDLSVRVVQCWEEGEKRLDFILRSPNDSVPFSHLRVRGPALPEREQFRNEFELKCQALQPGADGRGVEQELEKIGHWLCRTFFSPALLDAYRDFRQAITVQIVSNECWIPWEWIRPYDDRDLDGVIDDDFLCMRFDLSRWLDAGIGPSDRIEVARAALVDAVGGAVGEGSETAERMYFRNLAERQPDLDLVAGVHVFGELTALMKLGAIGLCHFFGRPHLQPDDVHGASQTYLARHRPFVFLDPGATADHEDGGGTSEAWSQAFVGRSRCGAFLVGTRRAQTNLSSELLARFYQDAEHQTLAQALRSTRKALRKLAPHDLTWLSYCLYSDPNSRLLWIGWKKEKSGTSAADSRPPPH